MSFPQTPGNKLTLADQRYVLAAYVHRFTGDHKPAWATKTWRGKPYPLQFRSDAEWLANTKFATRRDGRLDQRVTACYSSPTWPNGNPYATPAATIRAALACPSTPDKGAL